MKNKGGRPSKYKPEYCDKIVEFFSVEPWEEVDVEFTSARGTTWTKPERRANPMPTFHAFADKIGVNEDTIVEWAKPENENKYPGFSAAYKKAKQLQKWFLIENGLNGVYNPTFAIFTAKNVADMRDEQQHNVRAKIKQQFDVPAAIYQAILSREQERNNTEDGGAE